MDMDKLPQIMKVMVVGSGMNLDYHRMLNDMGHTTVACRYVEQIRPILYKGDIDVVLFVGGADVNPELYGHTLHPTSGISKAEDELYQQAFCQAQEFDEIKFVGICRGSQFLCAASGGVLVQHCDNHAVFNGHSVETKWGHEFNVTSTHHQMQDPREVEHELIAWTKRTTFKDYHIDGETVTIETQADPDELDIEVVWYPHTKSLAFQPHPEFAGAGETLALFKRCWGEYM